MQRKGGEGNKLMLVGHLLVYAIVKAFLLTSECIESLLPEGFAWHGAHIERCFIILNIFACLFPKKSETYAKLKASQLL